MKHIFLLLIVTVVQVTIVYSQSETGKKVEPRNKHQDHMMIDFGWETLIGKSNDTEFRWYNNGLNIQLFYDHLFGQSGVSGAVGVGFSTQSYYTNKQIRRDSTQGQQYSNWLEPKYIPYQKNKVSTSWIDVPFEIRYRTKLDDLGYRWKFAIGAKVGFLIDTHDKIVDQQSVKYKTYYFPDQNNIRFALLARLGYGKINFTAYYALTEFFIPGRGPEMKQLGIAISLVPF